MQNSKTDNLSVKMSPFKILLFFFFFFFFFFFCTWNIVYRHININDPVHLFDVAK